MKLSGQTPNGKRKRRWGGQGTRFARILPQRAEGAKNALESPPSGALSRCPSGTLC